MGTITPLRETVEHRGRKGVRLHMHPGQLKAWDSDKRIVALLWGPQSGKTSFGPHWLHREIERCGAGDYLAVTSTYDLFKLKMLPELRDVFEDLLQVGRYWPGARVIELAEDLIPGKFWAQHQDDKMWGRIILRSADAKRGLESATAKAAWLDEAGMQEFTRDAWDAVFRRLSLQRGRILITTTLYCWHWLKLEVFDAWNAGDGDIEVIQLDSRVNPAFPMEEYDFQRKRMPQWKFDLFYRGLYSRPAGVIYDSFDDVSCKIKRFPLDERWPRHCGMDFGNIATAAMFYAQDPGTGFFYAYRSYMKGGLSVAEHASNLKEMSRGENIIKRVGGAPSEDGWREAFTQVGWHVTRPKIRDVEVGIGRVYELHKLNKLFVFDDLLDYLDQKLSYSRELNDRFEPTDKIHDKESYHLMDAERSILSEFVGENIDADGHYRRKAKVTHY